MGWPLYLLLVISVSVTVPQAVLSQAVFSLIETSYAVREGDQFAVEIKKAGTAASPVNVVVQILSSAEHGGQDFIGMSRPTVFPAGTEVMIKTVMFSVRDDELPEGDEAFPLQLLITNGHGVIGLPDIATVTIVANDDAFGIFGFALVVPTTADELAVNSSVYLSLQRSRGTFGMITVSYEVVGIGDTGEEEDLVPSSGTVVFASGQASKRLQLTVVADEIPENDETFKVRLTAVTGGSSVSTSGNRPKLNESRSEAVVIILENDAPIRFDKMEYQTHEGATASLLKITVYRGLSKDGLTVIGQINKVATVNYYCIPRTATWGDDYLCSNGSVAFTPGSTWTTFTVQIFSDSVPEIAESFEIVLEDPNGDVVLASPSVTSIVISANDDYNGVLSLQPEGGSTVPFVRVNEDRMFNVNFVVIRSGGHYGSVSVDWELKRNFSSDPVADDVSPMRGTVQFVNDEREKVIALDIVTDNIPEAVERFQLRLLPKTATGGAKVEGVLVGDLVIEDSDAAHGIISLGSDDVQRLVTTTSPRKLTLSLRRARGTLGVIQVEVNITYFATTESVSSIPDVLMAKMPTMVALPAAQSGYSFDVTIRDEAFLQVGGHFQVELNSVKLIGGDSLGPFNTPQLGARVSVQVGVTTDVANGVVGFATMDDLRVAEPDGREKLTQQVMLPLQREGTNGEVTVHWVLSGSGPNRDHVIESDVSPMSGIVAMTSGQSAGAIILQILPDDLPETDEELTIVLTKVEPIKTQRLRTGSTEMKVIIAENDNAGGVFQFGPEAETSYVVKEEADTIQLRIVRTGGALVARSVQYVVVPNGEVEFYGATNEVRFEPGVIEKTVNILARGDGIPELNETFQLKLKSFGKTEATIGRFSTINITVLSNDDPIGMFEFSPNLTVYIDESKGSNTSVAFLTVLRMMGRFGSASVEWFVVDQKSNADLSPLNGSLSFGHGIGERTIHIRALPDELPEEDEPFTVTLTRPTNGAVLGENHNATIVINKNDDAIYFKEPSVQRVSESGQLTFTVVRDGAADYVATVMYHTVDGTATEASRDYVDIMKTPLVFDIGEREKTVQVSTLEDTTPETDENFYLELFNAEGDVSVYGTPRATIVIEANDDANGIFSFAPPDNHYLQEGISGKIEVMRQRGHFSVVNVSWTLTPDGSDFPEAFGIVTFNDLEESAFIILTPVADGIPEYTETFTLLLNGVTGGGPSGEFPRLAASDTQVTVHVLQNDDPFGVVSFADMSRELQIAEDVEQGMEGMKRAKLTVQRKQGTYEMVEVAWEVFSYPMSGKGNTLVDLLFLGTVPANVTEVPSSRRPKTGSIVLQFDGCEGCYVDVPSLYHMRSSEIRDGFSVSAWVRPQPNVDGYILAKTSADGSRHYYALKIRTVDMDDFYSATIEFRYSAINNPTNLVAARAVNTNFQDLEWHFILVTVDAGYITFYVDGQSKGNSQLGVAQLEDSDDGVLLVGAMAGNMGRYEGLLQDVRIFSWKLDVGEIREIYETPSTRDLQPISGYLTFDEGVTLKDIVIESIDDTEEESDEVFSVRLISSKGGVRVDEFYYSATLTVLKSDNANGLFGFSGPCDPEKAVTEDVVFRCPIERQRGDAAAVLLTWQIMHVAPSGGKQHELANTDFVNVTGVMVFEPGERTKVLTFQVIDDIIPEIDETFDVIIVAVVTADGENATTPMSGASISPKLNSRRIIVRKNDCPNGLLQFALGEAPSSSDDPRLLPAKSQVKISVEEEVGVVSLLVVRAQGSLERVSVEWKTVEGTARSSGKTPPDFEARVDELIFEPGQIFAIINVTILDNDIPDSEKFFEVQLVNPSGGSEIGNGSSVLVTILPSDHAYGVFHFDKDSLKVEAHETGNAGFNVVPLKIIREGGSIGTVNVTWKVLSDRGDDLTEKAGRVYFASGQQEANLEIGIRGDTTPEVDESFTILLKETSAGALGDRAMLRARLTIIANDDPFGVFIISSIDRPIRLNEADTDVIITVERKTGSGLFGSVNVGYRTLTPSEVHAHLPKVANRASATDFNSTTGMVVLMMGEQQNTFNVSIRDDLEPEEDETVFVVLTEVYLNIETYRVLGSPRLGAPTETYAQVIIGQNDNSSGILELSFARVSVPEGFFGTVVSVNRTAGHFGLVSVRFMVVDGSAHYGRDYTVTSTDVMMADGEREKRVPIEIVDDRLAEVDETFTVRLLGPPTGGAILGQVTETLVTIKASDDPYGAFGFETESISLIEPTGDPRTIDIPIVRTGGTIGVVAVDWQATLNGAAPRNDISPTSGSVFFVSHESRQVLTINVLPDDEPEGPEDIEITLTAANNGGRIETMHVFTISIAANDNPHGTVQFSSDKYVLTEEYENVTQYVKVNRIGGTFGELRLDYEVQELNILEEATQDNATVYEYYNSPKLGKVLPMAGTSWDVKTQIEPLKACASFCLLTEACKSFDFNAERLACNWFTIGDYAWLDNRTGYTFYTKDADKVDALYNIQAKDQLDFLAVKQASIILPDGATEVLLPVMVLADNLPELEEQLHVVLTQVALVGGPPNDPSSLPTLGTPRLAVVAIATNDNANGVFKLYSRDPRATEHGQVILVDETEKFFVELVVERLGGAIGAVSVTWQINPTRTTATKDADYVADGATLNFSPGELAQVFTIGIEDDKVPEIDEPILVELTNPAGGAAIGQFDHVTVIVKANDHVAGLISFSKTSYLVKEGDVLSLNILRSAPAIGRVLVDWVIEAINSQPPGVRFRHYNGTLYFHEDERKSTVVLHVLVDNEPKINQEYRISLLNVVTEGVRDSGAAAVDAQSSIAGITIEGGNKPHGVVSISPTSREIRVLEDAGEIGIHIDRKFGAIGVVRVYYDVKVGSLTSLDSSSLILATADFDFRSVARGNIIMYDGDVSAAVPIDILDDSVPEIDESFLVVLTSVELVSPQESTFSPELASSGTTAEVVIIANDGTQGEVIFPPGSAEVSVQEDINTVTLTIQRNKGTFGSVSVFCFAQSSPDGATMGRDFRFDPTDVHFPPGVHQQRVTVTILEDSDPEPNETFEVILASPKNGLNIGTPGKAIITILASDEANGIVNFETSDNVTINEPSAHSSSSGKASLRLVRAPGIYGIVRVPFTVIAAHGDKTVTDVTPASGQVTFLDKQASIVLEISAVADSVPEEMEVFYVQLLQPAGGATLGSVTRKTIIIERNDAPYGLLEIFAPNNKSSLDVEETSGTIYFDLVRLHGSLDKVNVDVVTTAGTAMSHVGSHTRLLRVQELNAKKSLSWHHFEHNGAIYVVLLNEERTGLLETPIGSNGESEVALASSQSVLYRWQGMLVPVQNIETDGASSATSFRVNEKQYLFITNFGASGHYQTMSRLYRVGNDGRLQVVQDLQTNGAVDATFITLNPSLHYLVIANHIDNAGRTNIKSDIYQWESANQRLGVVPVQYLPTKGARALTTVRVGQNLYLVVVNLLDSNVGSYHVDSIVYKIESGAHLTIHQQIPTLGGTDVTTFKIGGDTYLAIASSRDDVANYDQDVVVYAWNSLTELFEIIQHIPSRNVQTLHAFVMPSKIVHLSVAALAGESAIYAWDHSQGQFNVTWKGDPAHDLYPLSIDQPATSSPLIVILEAPEKGISAGSRPAVFQVLMLAESDYGPRALTVSFMEGETRLQTSVAILVDDLPEDTETFFVKLTNPRLGAELGANVGVTVNILSNDHGHGIIEFAEDSVDVREDEMVGGDNVVQLNLVRRKGTSSRVVLRWKATGEHNGIYDINPVEGMVEFADGQSAASITITIRNDPIPELDETTLITLVEVIEPGTVLKGRGAVIGDQAVARLTVLANDSPHGVVAWELTSYDIDEPEDTDTTLTLHIVRRQGAEGHIRVSYITSRDASQMKAQQAVSGRDYVAVQSSVDMMTGVTRVPVEVAVLSDTDAELDETFLVNITEVKLLTATTAVESVPSVRRPGNVATVTIAENDNARGVIQFAEELNMENRVDTYEGIGQVELRLQRTVGSFGPAEVTWQALPREADAEDFSPTAGKVTFADGQTEAVIVVVIIDDDTPEDLQTFDVKLMTVTSGGATLGAKKSVRVGILKNDSPNGQFSFIAVDKSVKESQTLTDPEGKVSFDIRRRGTDGVVNVQWRLSADAANDFVAPLAGFITFSAGEARKTLTLRTKPDDILEGEEHFTLSLVAADNNADISPIEGDATIVILADRGASGVISIKPDSRFVVVGEPSEDYTGKAEVHLVRTGGIFGEVKVTWQIVKRDLTAFVQTQGEVLFENMQPTMSILIQTKDDAKPEPHETFTLEITSATGGATITPDGRTAKIVVTASDFPHGLFEFNQPTEMTVSESSDQVSITVMRHFGLEGQVRVFYTTTPGTASSEPDANQDFKATSGWLTFATNQAEKLISVKVMDDATAEPPETFFVNLTRVELQYPLDNNYTMMNGLQIDMKPSIGPLAAKVVIIAENDNAQGVITFAAGASHFRVSESVGVASVPLSRGPGTYGDVSVRYTATSGTATIGTDFLLSVNEVVIPSGVAMATVNVTIVDDEEREFAETFMLRLMSATGGAELGGLTTATVTIVKSDYPNGEFGFMGQTELRISNPDELRIISMRIERSAGLLGKQLLKWRILGPNSVTSVLEATNDVYYRTTDGQEATRGTLSWDASEGGTKSFNLYVRGHTGWEIQKTFVVVINDIQGFPASLGSGEPSPMAGSFTLTVKKFGDPNGIVRFDGVAQIERTFDEPADRYSQIVFPIYRREGTIGTLQVLWKVDGIDKDFPDVSPTSGVAVIEGDKRTAEISLSVLADDVAEITERFAVMLTRVEGGGEVDILYNTSVFHIKYSDYPHGRFSIDSDYQTVVVMPTDLKRVVRLNITRNDGSVGRVRVSFGLIYNQPEAGVSYLPSSGSVTFYDGDSEETFDVDIESSVYLALGSTFTVTLTSVQFIGVGVTMVPELVEGKAVATVTVPQAAANSQVGFYATIVSVTDGINIATLNISRLGSYGMVQIDWQIGFEGANLPPRFTLGSVSPASGTVSLLNGVDSETFTVQLSPQMSTPELFAVHLPRTPTASVIGGARLRTGYTICRIEPHGVIQFAERSRQVKVTESDNDIDVTLYIERVFGSLDNIQVRFQTTGAMAVTGIDFEHIENGAVTLDSHQTTSSLFVRIKADNVPEKDESFFVNLTSVTTLPSDNDQDVSPRLSSLYAVAMVTIQSNNDPFGVVSLTSSTGEADRKVPEPGSVRLAILRTGGTFGRISVNVRSVGGGESWDKYIAMTTSSQSETIGQALGNRDVSRVATVGKDYQLVDATLVFEEGETMKTLTVYIMDDTTPEDDEVMFVYLNPVTEGVRVALPSRDADKMGYAIITIRRNDFWNGQIGFYHKNSSHVTADEDKQRPAVLTLERRNASYGTLTVFWKAKIRQDSDQVVSDKLDLTTQLERVTDDVHCAAGQRFCSFSVPLFDDKVPENETTFVIELSQVSSGAMVDPARRYATVTLLRSDHPSGMIQFKTASRHVYGTGRTSLVRLEVERLGYTGTAVSVSYVTQNLDGPEDVAGMKIYNALGGADYNKASGQLHFASGVTSRYIDITLDPMKASDNPFPKMFRVVLSAPTNAAELGVSTSVVTLVNTADLNLWTVWAAAQTQLDNGTIDSLIRDLQLVIKHRLTTRQLSIAKDILNTLLTTAESQELLIGTRGSIFSIFCQLLNPDRGDDDATRGHWQLSKYLERFAFTYVQSYACDTCCTSTEQLLASPECPWIQFSVVKWYPEEINGYTYKARDSDTFKVPSSLMLVQDHGRDSSSPKCSPVVFVQYSSEQWFTKGSTRSLLNHRMFTVDVKDQPGRFLTQPAVYRIHTASRGIAAKRAECVYFDEDNQQWTSGDNVCTVINNLGLAMDNYVDCSCRHMSNYAVWSKVKHPELVGYPVWFHISCFICMVAMVLVILCHHVCSFYAMFSANLLMHMCFAVFATELCYVIDAYLSPGHLLSVLPDSGNYRCIVMSLFLHYFFLAQFTWMMTQAVNFWKILVLNDEHTERKYVFYFLIGWGLPAVTVAIFYVVTYSVYRFGTSLSPDLIYGDVTDNDDICFTTNAYVALAGVVFPALLCLMVVGVIFIQTFQVAPQWQAYDDMYRGRYNKHEIRALLLFWACIVCTWLWGGLHMAYSQVWMLVLFCIFNIATGLYAIAVYALLRNPCLPCFRPQKAMYAINATVSDVDHLTIPATSVAPSVAHSVKGSRASLIQDTWEKESVPLSSHIRVKRTPAPPHHPNVYVAPPTPYSAQTPYTTKTPSRATGRQSPRQDIDDLIYALKNGSGFTTSDAPPTSPGHRYDRRKIPIADTHV